MIEPFQMIEITLTGTPRQRGQVHGEAVRPLIHELTGIFTEEIGVATGMHPAAVFPHLLDGTGFAAAAEQWTPDLVEEVRGIAQGANLPFEIVMGYQCIQEAAWYSVSEPAMVASPLSCTVVGSFGPDGPTILAQTADNPTVVLGRQVILHISDERTDIRSHVLTFPGIVGAYGLNDRGIGVCINEMVGSMQHSTAGLAAPFIARGILAQPSFEAADRFIRSVPHASGSTYTIGGRGSVVAYECSAHSVDAYVPASGSTVTCHTNHPLANLDRATSYSEEEMPNSTNRLKSAERQMQGVTEPVSWERVRAVLSSHDDATYPICRHPGPEATSVTCFGIIMECSPEPILHVSSGPPCSTGFRDFAF